MRKTISGMVAAVAVMMTAGAAPAMACGGLLQSYSSPCAPVYTAPVASYGCDTGCGGWARQRLPDPEQQYYYVNQGPTYTGPGNFAPAPVYREDSVSNYNYGYRSRAHRYGYQSSRYYNEGPAIYRAKRHFRAYRGYSDYRYSARPSVRYGYTPRYNHAPRVYGGHHGMRYGAPHHHSHRERVLRRYY